MKKLLALVIALAMVFALCACGGGSAADGDLVAEITRRVLQQLGK